MHIESEVIEPGIVDANVLVHALDTKAPQHFSSRFLLDAARNGLTTLYVTSQVLCEFYSIVTNARRVLNPRSSVDAVAAISENLARGSTKLIPIPLECNAACPHFIVILSPDGIHHGKPCQKTLTAHGCLRSKKY